MEYSNKFLNFTRDKKFTLIKLNESNLDIVEEIPTPKEFIFTAGSSYDYYVTLRIKNFIGICCFEANGILTINGWSDIESPYWILKDARFKTKVCMAKNEYYFLFLSENESDHVKLKLLM